jgi:hypothetical protein
MVREKLVDLGYENLLVFDCPDYDDAIIGVTTDNQVVYDYNLMVKQLMKEQKCSYEDAVDWLEHNTVRSLDYMGEDAPVIVTLL